MSSLTAQTCAVQIEVRAEPMLVQRGGFLEGKLVEEHVPVVSLAALGDGAKQILESFGAVELQLIEHYVPAIDSDAQYAICPDGDVHDFCSFGAYALPQLRAMGWQVRVAEDYPFRVLGGAVPWYADLEPDSGQRENGRNDWFELELGVSIDGQRISLLPLLLELLDRSGASFASLLRTASRCVALPVGDGVFLPVSAERLHRILAVLRELYEGTRVPYERVKASKAKKRRRAQKRPRLRVRRSHAAILCGLDEAFDDAQARLKWHGTGELRQLGRALLSAKPGRIAAADSLQATLRDYQQQGVDWLQHLRKLALGGILADDMGLGKTLQTIAHLLIEKEAGRMFHPALVVAPTSLVINWQREIRKFAPRLEVICWHGARRLQQLDRLVAADVIVTSYPLVWRDIEHFRDRHFHVAVLDEAQSIKNHDSRASRAVRTLHADQRLCLTGTPLENHLGELHSLFDFLVPGLLGNRDHFRAAYRTPIEMGNSERLEQLRRRVAPFILRRMKSAVASELPPKTEIVRPVTLDDSQRELYESIRIAAHADVRRLIHEKGLAASTIPVLDALMKLRQACCHPRLVRVPAAQKVPRSSKLSLLLDLVEQAVAEERSVLVFSQFARMLSIISEALLEKGIGHVTLTGQTRDRQDKVDAFQRGRAKVFLISLKAGGTGLTLTRADTVIHYDPWWNPAAQSQATDRAYRIGQDKPVFVYKLIVAGSVEERMLGLQERKQKLADAILSDCASTALSLHEVDDLFAPLED